ncbi:MAG: hypothetical protein ABDH28_06400 [Brevinematia bacterium]
MKHKEFKKKITEHLLDKVSTSNEIQDHLSKCEDCKNYFLKSQKFLEGLNKIKLQGKIISKKFKLPLNFQNIPTPAPKYMMIFKNLKPITLSILMLTIIVAIVLQIFSIKSLYQKTKNESTVVLNKNYSNNIYPYLESYYRYFVSVETNDPEIPLGEEIRSIILSYQDQDNPEGIGDQENTDFYRLYYSFLLDK